jgi:hypothetical protein
MYRQAVATLLFAGVAALTCLRTSDGGESAAPIKMSGTGEQATGR